MSATCPACGHAVVPGYVRCPNRTCRAQLRGAPSRAGGFAGGTVAHKSPLPAIAIGAGALVGIGLVAWLIFGGSKRSATVAVDAAPEAVETAPPPQPAQPRTASQPVTPDQPAAPARPSPAVVADDLQRTLRRQRLWSTVEVIGQRADIRSGSCAEPALVASVDGAMVALRSAGLTRLRCLEQSGRVVFTRDL